MRIALILAGTAAVLAPLSAHAIIMRHDVADADYRALGKRFDRMVVDVAIRDKKGAPMHGNGQGTFVAADWVITAAHVGRHIKPGHQVFFRGRPLTVTAAFLHPGYSKAAPWNDVALLKLSAKAPGARPACLYSRSDEVGKIATLVGNGHSGTGLTGPTNREPVLRGATVRIAGTEQDEVALRWTFNPPSDPNVTRLEGISGPGDSGGPAFLRQRGRWCIAGVSAAQDDRGLGEGRYTVIEYYPRVSHFRGWIESVMKQGGSAVPVKGS